MPRYDLRFIVQGSISPNESSLRRRLYAAGLAIVKAVGGVSALTPARASGAVRVRGIAPGLMERAVAEQPHPETQ